MTEQQLASRLQQALSDWEPDEARRIPRLADEVGVAEKTAERWMLHGELSPLMLVEVAQALEVTASWLLFGEEHVQLPIYDGLEAVTDDTMPRWILADSAARAVTPSVIGLRLDTTLFEPRYRHSELVLLDPLATIFPGDDVLILLQGEDAPVIMELVGSRPDGVLARSLDHAGARELIPDDAIVELTLVLGQMRLAPDELIELGATDALTDSDAEETPPGFPPPGRVH